MQYIYKYSTQLYYKRSRRYGWMFYNQVEIKSIVIAVQNIEAAGLNSKDVLLNSIIWLREQYEIEQNEFYLKKAVWHIYAYLELGYTYESGEKEFVKVLKYLQMDAEELFPKKEWVYNKIILKKSTVSRVLGKWHPYFQSMKIDEAVSDIINKTKRRENGKYIYHCGKIVEQYGDSTLWEKTFVLRITKNEAILQDVNRGKYYILSEV